MGFLTNDHAINLFSVLLHYAGVRHVLRWCLTCERFPADTVINTVLADYNLQRQTFTSECTQLESSSFISYLNHLLSAVCIAGVAGTKVRSPHFPSVISCRGVQCTLVCVRMKVEPVASKRCVLSRAPVGTNSLYFLQMFEGS